MAAPAPHRIRVVCRLRPADDAAVEVRGEEGRQRRVAAALAQQDAGRVTKDVVVVVRTGVGHQDSKGFTHARDDGGAQRLRIRAGGSLDDA